MLMAVLLLLMAVLLLLMAVLLLLLLKAAAVREERGVCVLPGPELSPGALPKTTSCKRELSRLKLADLTPSPT